MGYRFIFFSKNSRGTEGPIVQISKIITIMDVLIFIAYVPKFLLLYPMMIYFTN